MTTLGWNYIGLLRLSNIAQYRKSEVSILMAEVTLIT